MKILSFLVLVTFLLVSCVKNEEATTPKTQVPEPKEELTLIQKYRKHQSKARKRNEIIKERNKHNNSINTQVYKSYNFYSNHPNLIHNDKILVFQSFINNQGIRDSFYINPLVVKKLFVYGSKEFPEELLLFKNLEYLFFNGYFNKKISPKITQLKKLEEVIFKGTDINELPNNIHELDNLESLFLVETRLQTINESVTKTPNLKALIIGYCDLDTLPANIEKMNTLEELHVHMYEERINEKLLNQLLELEEKLPNCAIYY